MRTTVKYLSSACAGAMLLACADPGHRVAPAAPPAHTAAAADDAYLAGRQQHLASRFDEAIASYQAALRLDPGHVNASNGLATLHAERGDLAQAIALWRQRTAPPAPSGTGAAFLFSNLGYALYLHGDYQQAVSALERACVLDPLNHRAWRHLGSALDKLGQPARAQLMYKQASTLEQHDIKADYDLVKRSAAPAVQPDAAAPAGDGWATTELRQTGSAMFELHRMSPAAASAAAPAAAPPAAPIAEAAAATPAEPIAAPAEPQVQTMTVATPEPAEHLDEAPAVARLEIRNGNGVTGMARSLARTIGDPGVRVVRLSNEKGFRVEQTRVEFQGAFRAAASRLAERFGGATLRQVDGDANPDVRLVIGRDMARSKAEARRIIKAALARAAKAA